MFCTKCGAQIPDDSTFCSACGNAVNGATAPVAQTQEEPAKTVQTEKTPPCQQEKVFF